MRSLCLLPAFDLLQPQPASCSRRVAQAASEHHPAPARHQPARLQPAGKLSRLGIRGDGDIKRRSRQRPKDGVHVLLARRTVDAQADSAVQHRRGRRLRPTHHNGAAHLLHLRRQAAVGAKQHTLHAPHKALPPPSPSNFPLIRGQSPVATTERISTDLEAPQALGSLPRRLDPRHPHGTGHGARQNDRRPSERQRAGTDPNCSTANHHPASRPTTLSATVAH